MEHSEKLAKEANNTLLNIPTHPPSHPHQVKTTGMEHSEKLAKEAEKHVGLAGRFMGALQEEIKKDLNKFTTTPPKKK